MHRTGFIKERSYIKRKKGRFGKMVLMFSFAFITLYTAWVMWAQMTLGFEPAPTLTQWVYTFWGLEVVLLLLKKVFDKKDLKKGAPDHEGMD